MSAPRIALLVHNRFEQDPRVSRHARAALRAGYRVAVLSVGHATAQARWAAPVDGVYVYESRVVRRTWLGRLRTGANRLRSAARRSGEGPRTAAQPYAEPPAAPFGACLGIVVAWERGRLARFVQRDRVRGQGPSRLARPAGETPALPGDAPCPDASPCPERPARGGGLARALRDWWTIALLVRNNIGIYRQFRGIGAALVHANDLNVLLAGFLLARTWRVPLIYDSHELWTQLDEGWSPLLRRLFARLEGPLLRRADAVVTVNEPIARELARRYTASLPMVIMNCPEVPAASPGAQAKQGSEARELRVIYQGMLNPNRGLEGLIDAAGMVEGVTLAIRGPGVLGPVLQQHININTPAPHHVHLLPPVPMADLIDALAGYDVGVVPYLPTGMNNLFCSPNKLFEYMAAGLAVVCSDLPVLRDVVTTAQCGELYESGNVAALAGALRRLMAQPELLATYRRNARRAVETRYNAEREEGRLLALYRQLLERPRAHGSQPARGGGRAFGSCAE